MRNFRLGFVCLLTALLVVFVAGCGQETVTIPSVVSVTPAQGSTNVLLGATISANFNMAMSAASLTPTTFTLAGPSGAAVTGTAVTLDATGKVATLAGATLANGTTYTATITAGATTPGGSALIGNYVWSFTTIAAVAPGVPSLSSVTPAPFADPVALAVPITATFNQPMICASLATAFTVTAPTGDVAVTGATPPVTCVLNGSGNTVATFKPAGGALPSFGTTYTATISTGATAADGVAMAGAYVWSFTTLAATPPVVPFVVPPPTPAPFASNVSLTGAGATISVTFSQAMTPASIAAAGTFTVEAQGGVALAGSAVLNGAGTVATFTPTSGTLAYSTTYTATITTAATAADGAALAGNYVWSFTTLAATPPVVPFVVISSVTPAPFAPNVSLTGPGAAITATFNEAMTAASIAAAGTFTVEAQGGVPLAGSAVLNGAGTVATFTPTSGTLAYSTTYTATITTAATATDGAAMAGNYVWSFTTLAQGIPFVSSVTPAQGHANVPITGAGSTISATFSIPMSSTSINGATTFTVYAPNGVQVPGSAALNAAGTLATFTPTTPPLANNTTYTATITTAATSVGGSPIVANYVWSFTTITAAPTVIATDPVTPNPPGVTEDESVPLNQVITANFSEAMAQATIDTTNFALTPTAGGAAVFGSVTYIPGTYQLVFVPGGVVPVNLLPNTEYTATITGGPSGVTDLAGTGMAANYTWNFHTVTGASATAPYLVKTVPGDTAVGVQATNVPITQAISATFSEGMNTQTLFGTPTSTADFLVSPGLVMPTSATAIAGTYSYDKTNFIATFTPTSPLTTGSSYTATVVGATDLFGNVLVNPSPTALYPNTWTFTTGAAAVQPPVVLGPTITPFGGFAGTAGMTNTGLTTVINGDSGTAATAATSYTGFHDDTVLPVDSYAGSVVGCTYSETTANIGLVTRQIYTCTPPPTVGCPLEGTAATCAIATEALAEATTAYTTLQGLPSDGTLGAEIGGTTIYPGVWTTSGPVDITLGPLYLDAKGDPSAYFVFQIGTILTVGLPATPMNIILKGGAKASNIFWVVAGTGVYLEPSGGGTFEGTIIATNFIHVSTASYVNPVIVNGRLISLNASTTLVDTVINVPTP